MEKEIRSKADKKEEKERYAEQNCAGNTLSAVSRRLMPEIILPTRLLENPGAASIQS